MPTGSLPRRKVVALSLVVQIILVVAAAAVDWRVNNGTPLYTPFSMYMACARLLIPMAPLLVLRSDKALRWKTWWDHILGSGKG